MSPISAKNKLKQFAKLAGLFFASFVVIFYVLNFVDFHWASKSAIVLNAPVENLSNTKQGNQVAIAEGTAGLVTFEDWAKINNLKGTDLRTGDADKDGLSNYFEYLHGTDPNNKDSDGDGFGDSVEIANGYDPAAKGEAMTVVSLEIEKLGVATPMVWSKTDVEAKMLKDLENGVAHFVKTAAPGQAGNMVLSGHSSNYLWAKGAYNHIFAKLNDLQAGDLVIVKTAQQNGRFLSYKYQIKEKFITTASDEKIFANTKEPTLTLTTCWPLGTNLKRLIVKAQLVQ